MIFPVTSSFIILGKKKETNNVIRKRNAYWIPLKALIVARKITGVKDMAKL